MLPSFSSLNGLKSLDALGNRYGRLPHELIPDFPSDDPYVIYCFNEAVAIAGLSTYAVKKDKDVKHEEDEDELLLRGGKPYKLPHPQGSAIIGMVGGVPFISGKVPIVRKKKP